MSTTQLEGRSCAGSHSPPTPYHPCCVIRILINSPGNLWWFLLAIFSYSFNHEHRAWLSSMKPSSSLTACSLWGKELLVLLDVPHMKFCTLYCLDKLFLNFITGPDEHTDTDIDTQIYRYVTSNICNLGNILSICVIRIPSDIWKALFWCLNWSSQLPHERKWNG